MKMPFITLAIFPLIWQTDNCSLPIVRVAPCQSDRRTNNGRRTTNNNGQQTIYMEDGMKKILFPFVVLIIAVSVSQTHGLGTRADHDAAIREPAVAGQFYSDDSSKLAKGLAYYLEDAVQPAGERPIAILSPHAGYVYSGQIAADAFKQAAGHDYDLVVLLGTNHTHPGFSGVSVYPRGGYRTPLGLAKIDEDAASRLMAADKNVTFKESVHLREHSVEVQVPFVQTLFPNARILPAIVGVPDPDMCARFGNALADILKDRRALIVASSDLSHYPNYEDAVRVDRKVLDAITTLNPQALHIFIRKEENSGVPGLSTCACGEAPILAAMTAAKALGANCGRLVSYANSGDVSVGNRSRVVGYGAVSFVKSRDCKPVKKSSPSSGLSDEKPGFFLQLGSPPVRKKAGFLAPSLSDKHKKTLLSFARKTIQQYLFSETLPLARTGDPVLERKQGAFVTLEKHGQLRGCIGHMAEDMPLYRVVGSMALQAAFNDRRFRPLAPEEFPEIEIEISVLTPFQQVKGPEDILIGRDGVILKKDGRSAVFLPQVAPEQGWNRDETLNHLARKAGLSSDDWKADDAQFLTFQAIVFSE